MFIRYRVLIKIILDRDLRFIVVFLGSFSSRIRGLRSNINSVLPIAGRKNREAKLVVKIVPIIL